MALPEFNADGDMPPGVYPVTLTEALTRFGTGSSQRRVVGGRLDRIYQLVASTGRLARFVVFGSFVTAKADPRDVDIALVMEDSFDLADAQLGASVFWATRSGAFGGDQAMVEYWQARREGGLRGILEIVPGGS